MFNPSITSFSSDGATQEWATVRDHMVRLAKRMNIPIEVTSKGLPDRDDTKKIRKGDAQTTGGDDAYGYIGEIDVGADILEPPYPFEVLASLYENSSALRQNIDAMSVNIDGFGYRLEPTIDFSHPDIANVIRDLIVLEKVHSQGENISALTPEIIAELTPSPMEVIEKKRLWQLQAMVEKHNVNSTLEFVNPVNTFTELRQSMRESLELFGNAGWEVLRENPLDYKSKIVQIYNIPFIGVRLLRADKYPTTVNMVVRKNKVEFDTIPVQRIFRRYVRLTGSSRVYFKDFGDPRIVSRSTGRYYLNIDELKQQEGQQARPANELFHFSIRSNLTPYGVPRWIGALLSVLGSRAAEEVNFLYFDNKAIPPMVLLVSGGRVTEESVTALKSYFEEQVKGRENFHKIMIIEGLPVGGVESSGDLEASGRMRLDLRPLTGDMIKEALFQQYDAANIMKIGRTFRQAPLLTGDMRDANRSTSETMRALGEEQVYQPARDSFDAIMDRSFMPSWNARFWKFKTNAPVQRLPNDLVNNAMRALSAGAITPNEARALLADAFSRELDHIPADWAQIPPNLAQEAARLGALSTAEVSAQPESGLPAPALNVSEGQPQAQPQAAPMQTTPPDIMGEPAGQRVEAVQQRAPEPIKKEEVLRGKSSEDAQHSHQFVLLKSNDGSQCHILTLPAGDDPHSHPVASIPYKQNEWYSVQLEPNTPDMHTHTVGVKVPSFSLPKMEVNPQLGDKVL